MQDTTMQNQGTLLYCPNCKRHTPHSSLIAVYATQCSICNVLTNQLMRNQAESITNLAAPDGTKAIVVENNPENVVFYIPRGEHQGYYYHDKRTGENRIVAG
jgi:hypothetical protein